MLVGARAVVGLGCVVLAFAPPVQARSEEPEVAPVEVGQLRQELSALKQEYARRLADIESRLAALESGAGPAVSAREEPPPQVAEAVPGPEPAASGPAEAVPAGAAGGEGPSGALPVYGGPAATSKIFNPDIGVIGSFVGRAGDNSTDPADSLSLEEAEATFQAILDPYARANFFFSYGSEGVEIEEGYVSFPALPGGFLGRAGKMRTQFGKVNTQHTHALSWADRPLVVANLLGGGEGVSDSGISLSHLIPNPWLFLEAIAEVYRGESDVFAAPRRRDVSMNGRLHAYTDLGDSTNLDLGGSIAWGHNDAGPDRTTRLIGADVTFRYRPLRRAIYHRFLARAEAVWSRRGQPDGAAEAFGGYLSADYQFARRWFVGTRLDYSERADQPDVADKGVSAIVTFWPSEFNQVRGQYRLTRYGERETAHELLFQLVFAIGAHGAHTF